MSLKHLKRFFSQSLPNDINVVNRSQFSLDIRNNLANNSVNLQMLSVNTKNLVLKLYPADGQPCASVTTWDVDICRKDISKCRVTHKSKTNILETFKANIIIKNNLFIIWGKKRNDKNIKEDFELQMHVVNKNRQSKLKLEGFLGRKCKKEGGEFEETHHVLIV